MKHTDILNACLWKLNSALRDQLAPTNSAFNRLIIYESMHVLCHGSFPRVLPFLKLRNPPYTTSGPVERRPQPLLVRMEPQISFLHPYIGVQMWATSMSNHHLSTCGTHRTVFHFNTTREQFRLCFKSGNISVCNGCRKKFDKQANPKWLVYNMKNGDNTIHRYPKFPSQDFVTHTTMLILTAFSVVGLGDLIVPGNIESRLLPKHKTLVWSVLLIVLNEVCYLFNFVLVIIIVVDH